MGRLTQLLLEPDRRQAIVAEAARLIDEEVREKSGLSGLAVRGTFGLVKALRPSIVPELLDRLMPEFAAALDPIVAGCPTEISPAVHLRAHRDQVVAALLSVTDARARGGEHPVLLSGYRRLRPEAERQVAAAVPRLARLIERHLEPLANTAEPSVSP